MRRVWQLVAVTAIALIGGQGITAVHEDSPWPTLFLGVLTAVPAMFVYGWVVRRTERRPATEGGPGPRPATAHVLRLVVILGPVVVRLVGAACRRAFGKRRPGVPFHAHDVCAGQGMFWRSGVP